MLIALLAYLGGMLTIVSPCILPVLPFVFARAGEPFVRSGLPMLAGMALTFAAVATLAAVGGGWAVRANEIGRWVALALLALFGIALVLPAVSERLTRPLVAWGSRLSARAGAGQGAGGIASSLLLGAATGLLWAPCAGPILGIIFTAAALNGASASTSLLLLAYALGAATSLALALLAGGRVFARMKGSLGLSEWVRRGLGVAVLAGVAAIALGLDTRVLARLSSTQTASLESGIAQALGVKAGGGSTEIKVTPGRELLLPVEGNLPPLDGVTQWFNSPPLTREGLRGKVVLIDFWTYSCINCIRSIPHVRAWHDRYARDGLVVIGVHAPEFAFEKNPANVRRAIADQDIRYPVALDNDFAVWRAFDNRFWPAHYFIDAAGRVRYHNFGEGNYRQSEQVIRQLLREAGADPTGPLSDATMLSGAEIAAASGIKRTPETYLGHWRAARFTSPGGIRKDQPTDYLRGRRQRDEWSFEGRWQVGYKSSRLLRAGGRIHMRFHARDLHLVLGAPSGRPVRFRVLLDGKPPGRDAGVDVRPDGSGTVDRERLYQLIRNKGPVGERDFTIEFLDPGAEAFAFTFG